MIAAVPLRLVYAVDYTISLADSQGQGVLWLDASDGSLIGGDAVQ